MTNPRHRAPGPTPEPPASARPGRRRRGSSSLRLVWVYPDLLSTYGDRGNLLVLQRRARLRGIGAESIEVHADQPVPRSGDIYLMGGGEDLPQILAARRLRADGWGPPGMVPRSGATRDWPTCSSPGPGGRWRRWTRPRRAGPAGCVRSASRRCLDKPRGEAERAGGRGRVRPGPWARVGRAA